MSSETSTHPSGRAITSIAQKTGVTRETLRSWVRQAERDQGRRAGLTTDEKQRMKELEREVKELRRANEILKAPRLSSGRSSTASKLSFQTSTFASKSDL